VGDGPQASSKRATEAASAATDAHLTPAQKDREDGSGPAPKRLRLDAGDAPNCDLSTISEVNTTTAPAPSAADALADGAPPALVLEEPK
jgi:hypothetical protein